MALNKVKTTQFGNTVEYWKITGTTEDFTGNVLCVILGGYVSEAARQSGAAALMREDISIISPAYVADMTRANIYAALKQTNEWCDATDC